MDKKSIFRLESIDRVLSPEQLDEYIRVSNPSVWLVLIAFILLSVSVLIWGFTGTLPKTLSVNGLLGGDQSVVCFVDANKLEKDITGCKALIVTSDNTSYNGVVENVSTTPFSADEISNKYESDWVISKLVTHDYAYAVTIRPSGYLMATTGSIVSATLITEEVKPISYLLN